MTKIQLEAKSKYVKATADKQHRQFASAALFVLATLFATFVLSCAQEEKKAPAPRARRAGTGSTITAAKPQIDPATAVAVIETAKGTIEFEFLATEAPETSKNFIKNAQVMYYKGEKFNRAEELLIQAGSKLAAGETLPIENGAKEMSRGVVAMAKEEGASVSYASEFFICRDSTILDSDYTIFGNVTSWAGCR